MGATEVEFKSWILKEINPMLITHSGVPKTEM
jgi:hypothetical protein